MYLARELTRLPSTKSATRLAGAITAPCLHACKLVKRRMLEQDNIRQTISFIDSALQRLGEATPRATPRLRFAEKKRKPYILAFRSDMKFSATKEKLLEGLQQVQNVVSTRTTLPILSNVLLQAQRRRSPSHHDRPRRRGARRFRSECRKGGRDDVAGTAAFHDHPRVALERSFGRGRCAIAIRSAKLLLPES